MKFRYQARTKNGEIESGTIEASSREAALDVLEKYNLYPTNVKAERTFLSGDNLPFLSDVSKNDVIIFTRQMSILTRSNLPIVDSIETVANQIKSSAFKEKLFQMEEDVEGGSSLSNSFSNFPDIFSPFYVGMLKAGEKSGNIPESFDYLADYMEKNRDLRSQLMGALLYPAFVMVIFIFLLMLMSVFIIPSFEQVFAGMNIQLPLTTRIVISASKVLQTWWWLFLLGLGGLVVLVVYLFQKEDVKEKVDKTIIRAPLLGKMLRKIYMSRISLNLSTLISGGVSISEALEVTSKLIGNSSYEDVILKTRKGVRSGRQMTDVLSLYPDHFSPLFLQMVSSGEKTGSLDDTLKNIVDFYEKQVTRTMEQLLKFIEPIMIIILGGMVAFLSISLFLPLFRSGSMGF